MAARQHYVFLVVVADGGDGVVNCCCCCYRVDTVHATAATPLISISI